MFEQELPRFRRRLRVRLARQGLILGLQLTGVTVLLLSILRWLGFGTAWLGINSLKDIGITNPADIGGVILAILGPGCALIRACRSLPDPLLLSAIETRGKLGAALTSAWEFRQRQHPMADLLARRATASLQALDPDSIFPHPGFKGLPLAMACIFLAALIFRAQPLGLEETQALLQRRVTPSQPVTSAALEAANQLRELAGDARSVEELARQASRSVQDLAQGKRSLGEALESLGQLEDSARSQAELEDSHEALIQALKDEESPARRALEDVARQGSKALNNPEHRKAIGELAEATSGDQNLSRNLQSLTQGLDSEQSRHSAAEVLRRASELQAESAEDRKARRQAIAQLEQKLETLRDEITDNSASDNPAPGGSSPPGNATEAPKAPGSDPKAPSEAGSPEASVSDLADPRKTNPEASKTELDADPQAGATASEAAAQEPKVEDPGSEQPSEGPPSAGDEGSSKSPETTSGSAAKPPAQPDLKPEGAPESASQSKIPKAGDSEPGEPEKSSTSPEAQPSEAEPDRSSMDEGSEDDSAPSGFTDLAAELAKSLIESGMTPPKELMESLSGMAPEGGEPPQWARDLAEKLVEKGFKLPDDFEMPDLPQPSATNEPSPEMKQWQDRLARKLMEKGFEIPKGLEDAARKAAENGGPNSPGPQGSGSKMDPAWQKDLAERLQGLGLQAPEQKGGKPEAGSKSATGAGSEKAATGGEAGASGASGSQPTTSDNPGTGGDKGATGSPSPARPGSNSGAGEPAVAGAGPGRSLGDGRGQGAAENGRGTAAAPHGAEGAVGATTLRGGSPTVTPAPAGRPGRASSPKRARFDPLDEAERRGVELPPRYRDTVKRYFEKRASKEPAPAPETPDSSGE